MKKSNKIETTIEMEKLIYPNVSEFTFEEKKYKIKNLLPGQIAKLSINKSSRRKNNVRLISLEKRASYEKEVDCKHFGVCGSCFMLAVPYEKQLEIKKNSVEELLEQNNLDIEIKKIIPSEKKFRFRNKMEYSFGDEIKGGELNLGMHKKARFYDVISIDNCLISSDDDNKIRNFVEKFVREKNINKFNRNSNDGILRHLVIRKSEYKSEIMIALSIAALKLPFENEFLETLLNLELSGKIVSVYILVNKDLGDAVKKGENDRLIYGKDYFVDKINGLKFKITLFSFFQTNTLAAERLYNHALSRVLNIDEKIVFDLFCGTGTLSLLLAKKAKKVYGVEIVEEAVEIARENSSLNNIKNIEFHAMDVYKFLKENTTKPDLIVVDPPRAGMTNKACSKLIELDVDEILYVSCNPKTMIDNLKEFISSGYSADYITLVDLYPHLAHIEAVCLLSKNR